MTRARPLRRYAAVLALSAIAVSGCATAIAGAPVMASQGQASGADPGSGAGASGPSGSGTATPPVIPTPPPDTGVPDSAVGLKPGVPPANLTVRGDHGTDADVLAKDTIADLITFYSDSFQTNFGQEFTPPGQYVSYDSRDASASVCQHSLYQAVNASYALPPCNAMIWDRGVLLPKMMDDIGILSVPTVLAHEMGHRVQTILGFHATGSSVLVAEQQADCYAGAYWRWVNDGHSTYFAINQHAGMTQVLNAMLSLRDPLGTDPSESQPGGDGAHGSAFDRVFALSLGFANGMTACHGIDQASVDARVAESPFSQIPDPKTAGNLPITDSFLSEVADTANTFFGQHATGFQAPALAAAGSGSSGTCRGYTVSSPVTYCPPTNTVSYDLAELQRIGTPTAGFTSYNGDFSAIILLVGRYGLAAQAAGDAASLTGDIAGLRGLCYAGSWASWMRDPQGAKGLALSPNDLDKAVYEVINSPLSGGDANGASTASIFDRVQAFNIGVTTSTDTCRNYYAG